MKTADSLSTGTELLTSHSAEVPSADRKSTVSPFFFFMGDFYSFCMIFRRPLSMSCVNHLRAAVCVCQVVSGSPANTSGQFQVVGGVYRVNLISARS